MRINWKRLLITSGIVVVATAILGFLTWINLDEIIKGQKEQITLLENRSNELSQYYYQKLDEKKKEEEARAAAEAAKDTSSTKKTSPTQKKSTTDTQEEPTPQSQILFFYSPNCGTCIAQMPIVLELQSEGIPFVFFDVVANPGYISQYGITQVPTFILNGHKEAAFFTKPQLLNFWNTYK